MDVWPFVILRPDLSCNYDMMRKEPCEPLWKAKDCINEFYGYRQLDLSSHHPEFVHVYGCSVQGYSQLSGRSTFKYRKWQKCVENCQLTNSEFIVGQSLLWTDTRIRKCPHVCLQCILCRAKFWSPVFIKYMKTEIIHLDYWLILHVNRATTNMIYKENTFL